MTPVGLAAGPVAASRWCPVSDRRPRFPWRRRPPHHHTCPAMRLCWLRQRLKSHGHKRRGQASDPAKTNAACRWFPDLHACQALQPHLLRHVCLYKLESCWCECSGMVRARGLASVKGALLSCQGRTGGGAGGRHPALADTACKTASCSAYAGRPALRLAALN